MVGGIARFNRKPAPGGAKTNQSDTTNDTNSKPITTNTETEPFSVGFDNFGPDDGGMFGNEFGDEFDTNFGGDEENFGNEFGVNHQEKDPVTPGHGVSLFKNRTVPTKMPSEHAPTTTMTTNHSTTTNHSVDKTLAVPEWSLPTFAATAASSQTGTTLTALVAASDMPKTPNLDANAAQKGTATPFHSNNNNSGLRNNTPATHLTHLVAPTPRFLTTNNGFPTPFASATPQPHLTPGVAAPRNDTPYPGVAQPSPAATRKDTPFPGMSQPPRTERPTFPTSTCTTGTNTNTPTESTGFAANRTLVDAPTPGLGQGTGLLQASHDNGTVLPQPTNTPTVNDASMPPPASPNDEKPFEETYTELIECLRNFDDSEASLQHKLLEANIVFDTEIASLLDLNADHLDVLNEMEELNLAVTSALQNMGIEEQ